MVSETRYYFLAIQTIEGIILAATVIGVVIIGLWIGRQQWTHVEHRIVSVWSISGGAIFFIVIAGIKLHQSLLGDPINQSLFEMELLTGTGAGYDLGALVGIYQVTIKQRERELQNQRDGLAFLNRLLRHHVLNSIQSIDGYLDQLEASVIESNESAYTIIRRRTALMTDFVKNISTVFNTYTHTPSLENLDISSLLESEIEIVEDEFDEVDIRANVPQNVQVKTHRRVRFVFREAMENAVRHSDSENPVVDISIHESGQVVEVQIADNGPGMSNQMIQEFSEPGTTGDRPLGLYLMNRLTEHLNGRLTFNNNEPTGTIVCIELPRAVESSNQ